MSFDNFSDEDVSSEHPSFKRLAPKLVSFQKPETLVFKRLAPKLVQNPDKPIFKRLAPKLVNPIQTKICKICNICNKSKPFSEFNVHYSTKDKFDNRCKECLKKQKNKGFQKSIPRELDLEPTDFNNFGWQGGKYSGTVFENAEKTALLIRVGKPGHRLEKVLPFSSNETKKQTFFKAKQLQKEYSDKLFLTKNKYKLIKINNEIKYAIVQISQNYCTLIDMDQLDLIKNYTLSEHCSNKYNSKSYCGIWDNESQKFTGLHNQIINEEMVDHINRYPLDNRKCNLQPIDSHENNKNKTFIAITFVKYQNDKYKNLVGYTGYVSYYHNKNQNNQRTLTSPLFKTKEEALKWNINKSNAIDKEYIATPYYAEQSRKDYEEIMEKYAENFKWRDISKTENQDKDEKSQEIKNEMIENILPKNKRKTIYNKFLQQIDQKFKLPVININESKIDHIIHPKGEYKYCSCCDLWILTSDFFFSQKNYDNLDRRCKKCKYASAQKARKNKLRKDDPKKYNIICDICGETYSSKGGLTRHINSVHPDYELNNELEIIESEETEQINQEFTDSEESEEIDKINNEISRRLQISETLKQINKTENGKEIKKRAHEKRSETMRLEREKLRETIKEKECGRCGIIKSISEFNIKSAAQDGLQTNCKNCVNEIRRVWRAAKRVKQK